MKPMSAKNKIVIAVVLWLVVSAAMIMYGFNIFSGSNQKMLFQIQESKKELAALQEEKNSYTQAQKDLEQMQKKDIQPSDFFSKDITLVEELKILEDLQESLQIKLTVSGVSGTAGTAPKAKTQSDIVVVPYAISASGPFENILKLVQTLENLPFITNIGSLAVSTGEKGSVNFSTSANFYLRRN
jgi:Tfp pilus assembly protein PilO